DKVRAQVEPLDSQLAQSFIQAAQAVIDALSNAGPLIVRIQLVRQADGRVRVQFSAPSGNTHVIAASTNMIDWGLIGVAVDNGDGTFKFEDGDGCRFPARFYRIISR